jgi:hypothetical protein
MRTVLMDISLELIIALTSVVLTGLVVCLEAVGFGRAAIISATIAIVSLVASLACLQLFPSVWDAAPDANLDVLLARTDWLLWISQSLLELALLAAIVFGVAGSLRVWRRRSALVARFNTNHRGSAETTASTGTSQLTTRDCLIAVFAILLLTAMVCWELFDFAVTNRGVQYYRDYPLMLLLPVGVAALVGASLAMLSRYARRHQMENNPDSPKMTPHQTSPTSHGSPGPAEPEPK